MTKEQPFCIEDSKHQKNPKGFPLTAPPLAPRLGHSFDPDVRGLKRERAGGYFPVEFSLIPCCGSRKGKGPRIALLHEDGVGTHQIYILHKNVI